MRQIHLIKFLVTTFTILILLGCTTEDPPPTQAGIPEIAPLSTSKPTATKTPGINPDTPTTEAAITDQPAATLPATSTTSPSATPTQSSPDSPLMIEMTQIGTGAAVVMAVEIMATGEVVFFSSEGIATLSMNVNRGGILNWDNSDCLIQIKAYLDNDAIAVGLTDLMGNVVLETILHFEDASSVQGFTISPTNEWVSYTILSGERELLDAEFQDVEVASLQDGNVIARLTGHGGGGAGQAAWSPDGQRISFSDFDAQGNVQYFHSRPDGGNRIQITDFSNSVDFRPRASAWSPDGTLLALIGPRESDGLPSVWIVHADSSVVATGILVSGYVHIRPPFWWDENNVLLVASENEDYDPGLVWIDGTSGEVLHSLGEDNPPFTVFNGTMLLNDTEEIAYHNGVGDYYQYNRNTGQAEHWFDIRSQLDDPLFRAIYFPANGPVNFVGCQF